MKGIRKFVLLMMTAAFLTGCVQKIENTDTTMETSAVRALETNEYAENIQNSTKIYILKSDREEFLPEIMLSETDKTFSFSYDVMSSYLASGTYKEDNGQLELKTDDGKYCYTFDIVDDNTLKFDQKDSSDIKLIDTTLGEEIRDGAEFVTD